MAYSSFATIQRIALVVCGHISKKVEEYLFDWLLYGIVVAHCTITYGPFWGSLIAFSIMAPLSAYLCLLYIAFYTWSKRDWLGIEALHDFRQAVGGGRIVRSVRKFFNKSGIVAFVILSIYTDPFVTVLYFRQGRSYARLNGHDTDIFWLSVFLSNAYWTLRWTIIVSIVSALWLYVEHLWYATT